MSSLSGKDRGFVAQMLAAPSRRKVWPADYRAAEARYLDNFGILLQEVSDSELTSLIAQIESELRWPLPGLEAPV